LVLWEPPNSYPPSTSLIQLTKKQSRRAAQQSQPVGRDIEDWIKAKREELHQLRQPPQDEETAASLQGGEDPGLFRQ
jgi:hypothetical protein